MLEGTTPDQVAVALEEVASEILAEAGLGGAAPDAVGIARKLGLTVVRDRALRGRARYARLAIGRGRGRGVIFVGKAERPERVQWAIAHELGEIAVHRVFAKLNLVPSRIDAPPREQLANELARRILLPLNTFEAAGSRWNWELFELKRQFPFASHELIARRVLDLAIPVVMTVFDQGRVCWRRSNAVVPPPVSLGEKALVRAAHHSRQYQERSTDTLCLRVWPVHEPPWKREILRTEPLACGV